MAKNTRFLAKDSPILLLPNKESITSGSPSATGVYLFISKKTPLYIGKAANIKARLLSHFQNAGFDPKEAAMVEGATAVRCIPTDSEFKALVLEAQLIQKYHPRYNTRWKDDRSYLYVKIDMHEECPKVRLARGKEISRQLKTNDKLKTTSSVFYFGPFSSVRATTEILRGIRKLIPFCTQKRITKRACFYSKIGLCNPCPNVIVGLKDAKAQKELAHTYRRNMRRVIKILKGNFEPVLSELYAQMEKLTREERFEEAIVLRNRIFRFEHFLHAKSLLSPWSQSDSIGLATSSRRFKKPDEVLASLFTILKPYVPNLKNLRRVECYDVSNLMGKEATASMVVFTDGLSDKDQYRKFKIKNLKARSDVEMLTEVLKRRFARSGWEKPNLLVVDGGGPQVKTFRKALAALNVSIPLVGIAKRPDRLVISSKTMITLKPPMNHRGFNLVRHLRDESHRFARKYHLLLRKKKLLL